MLKAIRVLQDKIKECDNMEDFYSKELLKLRGTVLYKSEVDRLMGMQQSTIDIKKECQDLITYLSNKGFNTQD